MSSHHILSRADMGSVERKLIVSSRGPLRISGDVVIDKIFSDAVIPSPEPHYVNHTAQYAWSIRKINQAYNGPCMVVRRAGTDEEMEIGFQPGGLISTRKLKDFASPEYDLEVVRWYNQGTNGYGSVYDLTGHIGAPLIMRGGQFILSGGLPAVDFGGNSVLTFEYNASTAGENSPRSTGYTYAVVETVPGDSFSALFSTYDLEGMDLVSPGRDDFFGYQLYVGSSIRSQIGCGTFFVLPRNAFSQYDNIPIGLTQIYNRFIDHESFGSLVSFNLSVNGVSRTEDRSYGSTVAGSGTFNGPVGPGFVGADNSLGFLPFTGKVAELVLSFGWSQPLASSQLAYWNISDGE